METKITKKPEKNIKKIYTCDVCQFITSKKLDYNRHIVTNKHVSKSSGNKKNSRYSCDFCNKQYKNRTGLWKHKQICSGKPNNPGDNTLTSCDTASESNKNTEIVQTMMQLIKQNHEFKSLIIEQQKENQTLQKQLLDAVKDTGNTYNNTTHNNNQKFNLNLFLNTTCKDAMNMTDFIENIEVDFKDIENIGKNGYVSGMTDMILSRIKELDVTKRPLHCTDLKRETMYIKDNDEWSKDTPDNTKLHQMIDYVAKRNYAKIPLWRDNHPECQQWDHPQYEFCVSMMRNILGDVGPEQIRLDNKVIKNLSRHILVVKDTC